MPGKGERGVPRQLIEEHLCCHKDICCHQLEHYNEGENFLNHIDMRDETWIHYYEPKST